MEPENGEETVEEPEVSQQADDAEPQDPLLQSIIDDPKRTLREVKALREEAAENRRALRELQKAEEKRAADLKKADRDKMRANEERDELISSLETENTKLQGEIEQLRVERIRLRVGAESGLPRELWGRIQGETEEEMLEDAKSLAAFIPEPTEEPKKKKQTTTTPAPSTPQPVGRTDAQRRSDYYPKIADEAGEGIFRYTPEESMIWQKKPEA